MRKKDCLPSILVPLVLDMDLSTYIITIVNLVITSE
jgi:hypothetical protein